MAGKETPRQKMINMMYLIFIAMLALNLSKQILQSFGVMNAELTSTNKELEVRNDQFMQGLEEKAREQSEKYLALKLKADSIRNISTTFYNFLEATKEGAYLKAEEKGTRRDEYGKMDLTSHFTELYFDGVEYKEGGKEFIQNMDNFREGFVQIASSDPKLKSIADEVASKFSTDDIIDSDGKARKYLDYHYKEMPLIVGITKLSLLQSTLQNIEAQLLSTMLEGKLKIEASLTNFDAIVVADKSSFLPNENFTGKIILGKNDPTLKADKVIINGNELADELMQQGQTLLEFPAGRVGANKIEGEFQFTEEGEIISIPVEYEYEVVPPPNAASISADKMNVVYLGVRNPFTISIPGVDANKVKVSAPGLKKGKQILEGNRRVNKNGPSDYELDLTRTRIEGDKITITVTGESASGGVVGPFKNEFRVKTLPSPVTGIDNDLERKSWTKRDIGNGQVTASFKDFDFNLQLIVTEFKVDIGGQIFPCDGSELSNNAKRAIGAARAGTRVTFFDIQTTAQGTNVEIPRAGDLSVIVN